MTILALRNARRFKRMDEKALSNLSWKKDDPVRRWFEIMDRGTPFSRRHLASGDVDVDFGTS